MGISYTVLWRGVGEHSISKKWEGGRRFSIIWKAGFPRNSYRSQRLVPFWAISRLVEEPGGSIAIMDCICVWQFTFILRVILLTGGPAFETKHCSVFRVQSQRQLFISDVFRLTASGCLGKQVSGTLGHTLHGIWWLGGNNRRISFVREEVTDRP